MTLILTCLTHKFIVQVSDRRLVYVPNLTLKDDDTNKVVAYGNIAAFSYTGLSAINGINSDLWILNKLTPLSHPSQYTPVDILKELTVGATNEFKKSWIIGIPKPYRKLALVCGSWLSLSTGDVLPMVGRVSNFYDSNGKQLRNPTTDFSDSFRVLRPSEAFYLEATGQNINSDLRKYAVSQIRACIRKQTGPEPIARILRILMRRTSKQNPIVGKNLLEVSLPKNAYSPNSISFSGRRHNDNSATFHYIAADMYGKVWYAPHMVFQEVQVADMTMRRTEFPNE